MCDHSKQYYREADFQAIPGLTRQCVLDSDEEKAANGGVVGIYSGETEASVYAARAICANAGH